jgi:hypothetical protein
MTTQIDAKPFFGEQKEPKEREKEKESQKFPTPKHEDAKQQQASQAGHGVTPFQATDQIFAVATNYSVTVGPAWLEMTNPAAVPAGTITADIPIWGSGDLLSKLKLPVMCVILKPTITPAMLAAQAPVEAKAKAKAKPKSGDQPVEPAELETPEGADLLTAQLAGMGVETQGRHIVDDDLRAQYQAAIGDEVDTIIAAQPQFLTPAQQALTGMSPQGFPGLLPGLRASALPATMGIGAVTIDVSEFPAEISVHLVGTGSVPANSRWLFFTVQGV